MSWGDSEYEKKEILKKYRALLRVANVKDKTADKLLIRKAFNLSLDAHSTVRRKSGEPYIFHPIAVAQITAEEIGLGTTSIVCALLHDTVEDTEITVEDISKLFGEKIASIVEGLTKISSVSFQGDASLQAENFRKMLLTLSDDLRVILIKLADRLHNMRTLESMRRDKQLKIASETLFLYAPLAHRLGLYNIKSELEDLSFKYKKPEDYNEIEHKLQKGKAVRTRFINRFIQPIKNALSENNFTFDIKGRPKSVSSIWKKMQSKNIPFEEVYDVFAIRIILDSPPETEKSDCWKVYSIVTDYYKPNPDRLRDWISTPKSTGYEALHTTIMSPTGKWVEVQIRTKRMDEVAEKGLAAHWKYKESNSGTSNIDAFIQQVRETLENQESEATDFIDDFKLNFYSEEIFLFTPSGDLKTLPVGATALDFAFEIHTHLGAQCIGAKVNYKLVPLSHKLKSGDQVEILTSKNQKPKEDWLNFVVTHKAKTKIKSSLKEEKRHIADEGKALLLKKLKQLKIDQNKDNINKIVSLFKLPSELDLYFQIGLDKLSLKKIDRLKTEHGHLKYKSRRPDSHKPSIKNVLEKPIDKKQELVLYGGEIEGIEYKLAQCCNPIPGDDVFGFITRSEGIKIHRSNCPNAISLMSNYAYRIVRARWYNQAAKEFPAGIKIEGIDNVGVVNQITKIISSNLNVNMQSISFESKDGIYEGNIKVLVFDTARLESLIVRLKKVEGVTNVFRYYFGENDEEIVQGQIH